MGSLFEKAISKNISTIGKNSNNNMVFQNCGNPTILFSSNDDTLKTLGQLGKYDVIQEIVSSKLTTLRSIHPLYPEFAATVDPKLNRLISTPETSQALQKYPKSIKGIYEIDYSKYPKMDKSEAPWEYAYRTQTKVELKTKAYKEYLGDIEDPFPVATYSDDMFTVICPPEFPEAVEAHLIGGDTDITMMIRRMPCMEYGILVFGNVSAEHGFDLKISIDSKTSKTTINIIKTEVDDLNTQLLREKLLNGIYISKKLSIFVDGKTLLTSTPNSDELKAEIFRTTHFLINYIESLISIEKKVGCHFDPHIKDVSNGDYITALVLCESLNKKWKLIQKTFDKELRCDFDHFSSNILDVTDDVEQFSAEAYNISITLAGVSFAIEKYMAFYTDAKINNLGSIKKNIRKKKKNILVTIKPKQGKDKLNKYVKFEGISVISL